MVWEETFRNKVPLKPGTIIQVWKDFGEFKAALTVLNVSIIIFQKIHMINMVCFTYII